MRQVNVALEVASAVAALEAAYQITRRGGTTVTVSLPPPTHTIMRNFQRCSSALPSARNAGQRAAPAEAKE